MAYRSRAQKSIAPEEQYQPKRYNYEEDQMEIDTTTGELITHTQVKGRTLPKEPNYIKLYIDTMLSFQGIKDVSTDFIIAMSKCIIGYNNDSDTPLVFKSDKLTKQTIAKELNYNSEASVNKQIKRLVDSGVLIKTSMRGVYYCNPWIIARGSWSRSVCGLRAHFNFANGEWRCDIDYKESDPDVE